MDLLTPRRTGLLAGFFVFLLLAGCRPDTRPEIPWKGSFPLALEAAIQVRKPVLVYWNAEWCTICRRIERESFSEPEVAAAIGAFVPVKVDIDRDTALAARYSVDAVPAFMLIDTKGKVRGHILGYKSPAELSAVLGSWAQVVRSDSP